MGRRPNPLILEFFERGAKLDDQSNRYEHTCKRCGMFFPKGRPDSMNRHLFEKCPDVSEYDKARAFAYAQGQMNTAQITERLGHPPNFQNSHLSQVQTPIQYPTEHLQNHAQLANSNLNREPSALDTLAEVSRQHLDLSRQRLQTDGSVNPVQESESQQEMDSWMIQLSQHLAESNQGGDTQTGGDVKQSQEPAMSQEQSAPLVQTASAASQLQASLEGQADSADQEAGQLRGNAHTLPRRGERVRNNNNNLDPALRDHARNDGPSAPEARMTRQTKPTTPTPMHEPTTGPALYPADVPMPSPETRGYGLLDKPLRKQRRNKFSAEGRKKVGGIRKLGACLRCRMLKKPCSGETPCATCGVIGAPRLWRAACIRTRLADEFTLFNTSYFFAKARDAALSLTAGAVADTVSGRINISLGSKGSISFPASSFSNNTTTMSAKSRGSKNSDTGPLHQIFTINIETEDPIASVSTYLASQLDRLIEDEPNNLLATTLARLHSLSEGEDHDVLITRTLTLWAATRILVAPSSFDWTTHYTTQTPTKADPISLPSTRPDHPILQSQILDAIERFAAHTVKQVTNELERRLLSRATSTPLTTLLTTIVLLNTVERISLFFRGRDTRDATSPESGSQEEDGVPDHWPLTKTPAAYFTQGARFADLLTLLLKMRNLPPRTVAREDDSLAVVKIGARGRVVEILPETEMAASGEDAGVDGAARVHGEDEARVKHMREVAGWLGRSGMRGRELWAQRCKSDDDTAGDWRAWDLRFGSALVLPEGYGEYLAEQAAGGGVVGMGMEGMDGMQMEGGDGNGGVAQHVDPALMQG